MGRLGSADSLRLDNPPVYIELEMGDLICQSATVIIRPRICGLCPSKMEEIHAHKWIVGPGPFAPRRTMCG